MTNSQYMNLYSRLKSIVLSLLPRKLLFRYEGVFRSIYYLKYKGKDYCCNICNAGLKSFVPMNGDRLCPKCGSLERTRRLWNIVSTSFLANDPVVLDFSPSRNMYRKMKKAVKNYISTDLSGDFIADQSYDITNIECPNNQFDLILCYHVLEHIDDDQKAMSELYRVLKPGGHCIIQTPFHEGDIYEDSSITDPVEREIHFGQDDHVRIYSVDGLKERLEKVGFEVDVRTFEEQRENQYAYAEKEVVLIASR
ncbi:MAG: class I SAM-dependent methyltransferase [Cryomorphaceae bacterium]|nr:class I SAM-dependent methyltransferase [Cryomorphaceae bacterium]